MKISKRGLFTLIFLFLILVFLNGCAPKRFIIKPPEELDSYIISLKGQPYIPLDLILNKYSLNLYWDDISDIVTLEKKGFNLRLIPNSKIVVINGESFLTKSEIKYYRGSIIIPYSLATKIIESLKPPLIPPITYKKYEPVKRVYQIEKIAIDPGHGGKDPGAIGRDGTKEKDLVLDISKRLERILEREGIEVVLTRDRDRFISLWRRGYIANKSKADIFISIHANSSRYTSASGFEAYFLSEATDDEARALAAAENASLEPDFGSFKETSLTTDLSATLWDMIYTENRRESIKLAKYIFDAIDKKMATKTRGIKSARFYVLKGAQMPSVLLEVGFISNRYECFRLNSPEYKERLAQTIAEGILAYKYEYERTNGFTE